MAQQMRVVWTEICVTIETVRAPTGGPSQAHQTSIIIERGRGPGDATQLAMYREGLWIGVQVQGQSACTHG